MSKPNDLLNRTRTFALTTVRFYESLPKDEVSRILGKQLLRAGTSVGANYRAAYRARSKPDFISKMGIVLEEADESSFWIDLLTDAGKVESFQSKSLLQEANELVAISIASINTAKRNLAAKR